MPKVDPFTALATSLGYPESPTLPEILAMIATPEEATWLLALPNTPTALAAQFGHPQQEMAEALRDLFMRGLVSVKERSPDGLVYQFPSMNQLMDFTIVDGRYDELGEGLLDLWQAVINDEYLPAKAPDSTSGMRVIPVESTLEAGSAVLPHEQISEIVSSAKRVVVQECPCRKRERRCDTPLELCFSLNDFADYVLFRDAGRELTTDEALGLLLEAEQLGLVHQVDNMDQPSVICNCCHCCCTVMRGALHHDMPSYIGKSRYLAVVDQDLCNGCELCLEPCHVGALVPVDGVVAVNAEKCHGCGLCVAVCQPGALLMTEVREAEHIPQAPPDAPALVLPPMREALDFKRRENL